MGTAAPRAQAYTAEYLQHLPAPEQQAVVDAFTQANNYNAYGDTYPKEAARAVREAIRALGDANPADYTLASNEVSALIDTGLLPDAAEALVPESMLFSPLVGAGAIVLQVAVLAGTGSAPWEMGYATPTFGFEHNEVIAMELLNNGVLDGFGRPTGRYAECLGDGTSGPQGDPKGEFLMACGSHAPEFITPSYDPTKEPRPESLPAFQGLLEWEWAATFTETYEGVEYTYAGVGLVPLTGLDGAKCEGEGGANVDPEAEWPAGIVPTERNGTSYECFYTVHHPYKPLTPGTRDEVGAESLQSDWKLHPFSNAPANTAAGCNCKPPVPATHPSGPAVLKGIEEALGENPGFIEAMEVVFEPGGPGVPATVPNCVDVPLATCEALIVADELKVGEVAERGFSELDTAIGSHNVVQTYPGTGVDLMPGEAVEIERNPAYVAIPGPATETEWAVDYAHELEVDGFTNVHVHVSTATHVGIEVGRIVSVDPADGVAPETGSEISIESEPASEGDTEGGTGGEPPGAGGLPFDPPGLPDVVFPKVPTPCNVFPFGVPCWLVHQLESLRASAAAPSFTINLPSMGGHGQTLNVDLGNMFGASTETVIEIVRPLFLFTAFLGFMLFLAGRSSHGESGQGGQTAADSGGDSA
jgi:hypothetical protein